VPVVLRRDGFRFFFYANEGHPPERPHIHVRKAGMEAKFWLEPEVQLARNDGFDSPTLRLLARMTEEAREELERAWHAYFS